MLFPKVEEKAEPPCPPPNAPRVGDVAQNQKERVSGYELQNGICVTLYEDIPLTAQYLPAPQVAATTAGIAVVATFCSVSKTTGRFIAQSIQTCYQKSYYKDIKT